MFRKYLRWSDFFLLVLAAIIIYGWAKENHSLAVLGALYFITDFLNRVNDRLTSERISLNTKYIHKIYDLLIKKEFEK